MLCIGDDSTAVSGSYVTAECEAYPVGGRAISRGRRSVILRACLVDVTGVPSDRSERALAGLGMP